MSRKRYTPEQIIGKLRGPLLTPWPSLNRRFWVPRMAVNPVTRTLLWTERGCGGMDNLGRLFRQAQVFSPRNYPYWIWG